MRPYIEPAARLASKPIKKSDWPATVTATQLREIRERIMQSPRDSIDRIRMEESISSDVAKQFPVEWAKNSSFASMG